MQSRFMLITAFDSQGFMAAVSMKRVAMLSNMKADLYHVQGFRIEEAASVATENCFRKEFTPLLLRQQLRTIGSARRIVFW
jgi:hypothetical protein